MVEWANPNIDIVVDAYYSAITSRFPKTRYHVGTPSGSLPLVGSFIIAGYDSFFLWCPLSLMPDWLIMRFFGRVIPCVSPFAFSCSKLAQFDKAILPAKSVIKL